MKSCILTIIKDEQEYLNEFIEYHLNLGIDYIIICEDIGSGSHSRITANYSSDRVILLSILDVFAEKWRERIVYEKTHLFKMQQVYLYNALKYVHELHKFDWCFLIDVDEYITLQPAYQNINQVLNEYNNYDAVLLQWKNYGANGLVYKPDYSKAGIIDTFTKVCDFQVTDDKHWYQKVKTAYNLNHYFDGLFLSDHLPNRESNWCKTNHTQDKEAMVYDKMYLRHYLTKSFEEYVYKLKVRGMFFRNHRGCRNFFEMNPDMLDRKEELMGLVDEIVKKYQKEDG